MKAGTCVLLYGPKKREATIKAVSRGVYTVNTAEGKTSIPELDIVPRDVHDFVEQQVSLCQQILHFAHTYSLVSETLLPSLNIRSFVVEYKPALESDGDLCCFFDRFLALKRSKEALPYALLVETFSRVSDADAIRVTLDNDSGFGQLLGQVHGNCNSKYIRVHLPNAGAGKVATSKRKTRTFYNQKVVYAMDMGYMYMMVQHSTFREAFVQNVVALKAFGKCTYQYHPFERYLSFDDDVAAQRMVGFNARPDDFLIKSKETFTKNRINAWMHRQRVYDMPKLAFNPPTPMHFLHLQFVYAMHMVTFLKLELHLDFHKHTHWKSYYDLCQHLLSCFQEKEHDTTSLVDTAYVINLMSKYKPQHGYLLPTEVLRGVWESAEKTFAWLSLFEHVVLTYNELLDATSLTQEFRAAHTVAIINNSFIGSFEVDPIIMQNILFQEEAASVTETMNAFVDKREENVVNTFAFRPRVEEFANFM